MRTALIVLMTMINGAAYAAPPSLATAPRRAAIEFLTPQTANERQRVRLTVDDVSHSGFVDYKDSEPQGRGWAGRLDEPGGVFAIAEVEGRFHARIHVDNKVIRFEPARRGGGYLVSEVTEGGTLECATPGGRPALHELELSVEPPDPCRLVTVHSDHPCYEAESAGQGDPRAASACALNPEESIDRFRIHVMVGYTQGVAGAYSRNRIATEVSLNHLETNLAFILSNVPARVTLARTRWLNQPCIYEVDYDGNVTRHALDTLLEPEGQLRSLRLKRDSCRADLVLLMLHDADNSGMACVMRHLSREFAPWAYGAVDFSSTLTSYVYTHEIGHLMGAGHEKSPEERVARCLTGMCLDSAGWHWGPPENPTRPVYRSMMAYTGKRTLHFSAPEIDYDDTGVWTGSVPSHANNARTLRITAETVSKFSP